MYLYHKTIKGIKFININKHNLVVGSYRYTPKRQIINIADRDTNARLDDSENEENEIDENDMEKIRAIVELDNAKR